MKPGALLLFPGAGSDRDHSSLRALDRRVEPAHRSGARRLPLSQGRQEGARPPTGAARVGAHRSRRTRRSRSHPCRPPRTRWSIDGWADLFDGGRRRAARPWPRAAVLSAPPARPPDRLRTEHLPQLDLPCLFIHGTKDPFGTPAEIEAASESIPGPVTHVWIDRAGHDLRGADEQIVASVTSWLSALTMIRSSGLMSSSSRWAVSGNARSTIAATTS